MPEPSISTCQDVGMWQIFVRWWWICCTTSSRIVVSSSVDGVVQHVRSRCPCSGVWHLWLCTVAVQSTAHTAALIVFVLSSKQSSLNRRCSLLEWRWSRRQRHERNSALAVNECCLSHMAGTDVQRSWVNSCHWKFINTVTAHACKCRYMLQSVKFRYRRLSVAMLVLYSRLGIDS